MNKDDQERSLNHADELSIADLVAKIKFAGKHLRSKWLTVLIFSVLGALMGLGYSLYKKPVYTALSTFVLDESSTKGGGLGQYAGLASLAGIDISGTGGGGIFQGDNILELYKSRTMIEKTLLSPVIINKQQQLLIERFINFNNLRKNWKSKDHMDTIVFTGDPEKFNRNQDSIITNIVELLNKKNLNVARIDKKLAIIQVSVSSNDELFAKEFNNKLVQNVNNFYIETKTQKSHANVVILQRQADSVKKVLDSSINGVASAIDAAPNANPALLTLRVPSQKKQVDVQANTAIYSEIVKNLEISKIALRQEAPLIQIIDSPVLPLKVDKVSKIKGTVFGFIIVGILTMVVLFATSIFSSTKN